jgi:hypothetical protein
MISIILRQLLSFYYIMMIVDKFNRNLEKYSHNLTALRILRAAISRCFSEELLTYLATLDEQEKGYFTVDEIIRIWLDEHSQEESNINRFITKHFNFQKISFTMYQIFNLEFNNFSSIVRSIKTI